MYLEAYNGEPTQKMAKYYKLIGSGLALLLKNDGQIGNGTIFSSIIVYFKEKRTKFLR